MFDNTVSFGPWKENRIVYHRFEQQNPVEIDNLALVLQPHQQVGLEWMIQREVDPPGGFPTRGGILADSMGLGKTIMLLALVAVDKFDRTSLKMEQSYVNIQHKQHDADLNTFTGLKKKMYGRRASNRISLLYQSGLKKIKGTLVICPKAVLSHWISETQHYEDIIGWQSRKRDSELLRGCDICITSYTNVRVQLERLRTWLTEKTGNEISSKPNKKKKAVNSNQMILEGEQRWPLFTVSWRRIVLDEAHIIKNDKTGVCRSAFALQTQRRWAMTGTPIMNNINDLASLF
ncbi:MAG: putative SNF2, helicase and zinc finger protein [Streblomastix strix]|uniref:Putative SNF2, helicase and zinc finger protein n=1 Tax=Streblomastix strix TaxID=222440 RepID=A0A5J4VU68_9EUKA|nr:MAG: putative SNF2, helicase and zinc finger protein [Streblomastix strix]